MPKPPYRVRPETAVLTRGFDPPLSVGAARPPVYRTSTFVFSSPEAAERAFAIALGKLSPTENEDVDLIYARLSHPNAEILEDQLVPLERGAEVRGRLQLGHGGDRDLLLRVPAARARAASHAAALRRHAAPRPPGARAARLQRGRRAGRRRDALARAAAALPDLRARLRRDAGQSDAPDDRHRARRRRRARRTRRSRSSPSTTRSSGRRSSIRSSSAPISSSIRRRSSSAGRATSSAASCSRATRGSCRSSAVCARCSATSSRPTSPGSSTRGSRRSRLRMKRQSKNAQRIAERLAEHPRVRRVYYPSLFTDPEQQRIRDAQCDFPGSVFSIEVEGGKRGAFEFLRRLKIARNAVSLGGIETLACHPKTTTHSELLDDGARECRDHGCTRADLDRHRALEGSGRGLRGRAGLARGQTLGAAARGARRVSDDDRQRRRGRAFRRPDPK